MRRIWLVVFIITYCISGIGWQGAYAEKYHGNRRSNRIDRGDVIRRKRVV